MHVLVYECTIVVRRPIHIFLNHVPTINQQGPVSHIFTEIVIDLSGFALRTH